MRYEVTLDDGWKMRVDAASSQHAAQKAESYPIAKGATAIRVERCHDVSVT